MNVQNPGSKNKSKRPIHASAILSRSAATAFWPRPCAARNGDDERLLLFARGVTNERSEANEFEAEGLDANLCTRAHLLLPVGPFAAFL